MAWIRNVSIDDIKTGNYIGFTGNTEKDILIQIVNPDSYFPEAKTKFKEIHQFKFLDAEDKCNYDEGLKISTQQAQALINILQNSLNKNLNILVHCHQGLCRSGAVAEVGVMMGFDDTFVNRIPNVRVKTKMMKLLGWYYENEETPNELVSNIEENKKPKINI